MMLRKATSIWVAAGLIAALAAGEASAGMAGGAELACETENESRPSVPIHVDPVLTQDAAYRADRLNNRLVFMPRVAQRLPDAVVKLDFAKACLELTDRPSDTCAATKFLSFQGAIDKRDVSRIERYYVGLAEREPARADDAYSTIKQIFACF